MKNNIRVNDIPLNERPIEKLLQFGEIGRASCRERV